MSGNVFIISPHSIIVMQAHRMNFAPSCSEKEEAMNKTVLFDDVEMTNAGLADGSLNKATGNTKRTKAPLRTPCGSLTSPMLEVFPDGHVTFFSLDVEGAEPQVLKNLDFEKVFIELMIVENFNQLCRKECATRRQFRKIMNYHGYKRFSSIVARSDLFIHPSSKFLNKMGGRQPDV